MRETQRNIRAYKKKLIGLKEKLATAGLLFLMSAVMLTTASFAWIVLSTAPEVTNISTTISGNGNLEIALASSDDQGTPLVPAKSAVGDSNLPLIQRNITWGNLVNLNDDSYGFQEIILRPATLNSSNDGELDKEPLYAVLFGNDGRVTQTNDDYAYTSFDPTKGDNGEFVVTEFNKYGVRAISNIKEIDINISAGKKALGKVEDEYSAVFQEYMSLVDNQTYMDAIAGLLGAYMTAKLNDVPDTELDVTTYFEDLYPMMKLFYNCLENTEKLYQSLANVQLVIQGNASSITLSEISTSNQSQLESKYSISLDGYGDGVKNNATDNDFKYDKERMKYWIDELADDYQNATSTGKVYWSDIKEAVNFLVDINSCTVAAADNPGGAVAVGSLGVSAALKMLDADRFVGVITKGAIWNMEKRIGAKLEANVSISVRYIVPITKNATVTTNATKPFIIPDLFRKIESSEGSGKTEKVAGDVYGMAIDFWVRTNDSNTYLTLEGETQTREEPVKLNGKYTFVDKEGTLYYHIPAGTLPDDPTSDKSYLLEGTFYYQSNGEEVKFADTQARELFVKDISFVLETIVVGYDGVNRVWQESTDLSEASTTMGNGSCYIFYPNNPVEQQQMIQILNAMSVAFIDVDGNLLAEADMKTNLAYDEVGKVTVPLELKYTSTAVENSKGETVFTITPLERAVEKLITAIVYIDGARLTNADVSSELSLSGYLNLQFGSSSSLEHMDDLNLKYEEVHVTAEIDKTELEYSSTTPSSTGLAVTITGMEPSKVEAVFTRKVNEAQGVKQKPVSLTKDEDNGIWTANVPFVLPGEYVLRSVWIDGHEYSLDSLITVNVLGFDVSSIYCDICDSISGYVHIMTENRSQKAGISVTLATGPGQYQPEKVQAIFMNEDNQYVNATLVKGSSSWTGEANFTASGLYQLVYLLVDNEYYTVEESMKKTISLVLGVQADIVLSETEFEYDPLNPTRDIDIVLSLYDDKGNDLTNLSNLKLQYMYSSDSLDTYVAELEWNETRNAYTGIVEASGKGQFHISKPGVYIFNMLSIGSGDTKQTLYQANAQKLTVINPNPPVYSGYVQDDYQFAPDNYALMSVLIENSESAKVNAVMKHSGKEYEVIGTSTTKSNGIPVWDFEIPVDTSSSTFDINGEWRITELKLSDVYYNDHYYSSNNNEFVSWNMESKEILTTIVNDVSISVKQTGDNKLQSDVFTDYLSGAEHYINGYTVVFMDANGNEEPIRQLISEGELSLGAANLVYSYDSSSTPDWWNNSEILLSPTNSDGTSNSNYSSTRLNPSSNSFAVSDNQNNKLVNNNNLIFYYPGDYYPLLTVNMTDPITKTTSKNYRFEVNVLEDGSVNTDPQGEMKLSVKSEADFVSMITIEWLQPDAYFSKLTPSGKHYASSDGVNANEVTNTISDDKHHIEVWFDVDAEFATHVHGDICCKEGLKNHSHGTECCSRGGLHFLHKCNSNNCSYGYEHSHNNSCFSNCTLTDGYTVTSNNARATSAEVSLINVTNFTEASLMIDSSNDWGGTILGGAYNTDVTYSFKNSVIKASSNIGIVDTGVYSGNRQVMGHSDGVGALAEVLNVSYNSLTFNFDLAAPLIVNQDNGGGY